MLFILEINIILSFITLWIYMHECSKNGIGMFQDIYTRERMGKIEKRIEKLEQSKEL